MKISVLTYCEGETLPKSPPKVPESLGIRAIPKRIVGLYGFRAAREGIAEAIRSALRAGKTFHRIEMEVDVGEMSSSMRVGLKTLSQIECVNFSFCKIDLIHDVLSIVGGDPRETIGDVLSRKPENINLLWKNKRYAHIKAFIADIQPPKMAHPTRVAFLRSAQVIDYIRVTSH